MTGVKPLERNPRLRTPRAAAVAGILFGLLFATSVVLVRLAIPEAEITSTDWITREARRLSVALFLMPFAGIAFLWFIGVIRDLLGEHEDQFFSTVFFGSGLLFLAMVFVSTAIAGGLVAGVKLMNATGMRDEIVVFGRSIMFQISNVYALRMAGVFMISLGTVWLRTRLMPRWLAIVTYLLALLLLLVINFSLWVSLIFPGWVFGISLYILLRNRRRPAAPETT